MSKSQLKGCIPILRVKNAEKSMTYYKESLGFSIDWEHRYEEGYPLFVSISRDKTQLFLSEHEGDGKPETHIYIGVDSVDELYSELASSGVDIRQKPENMPFGIRQMSVSDTDHNIIIFGTPIDKS